MIKEVNRNYKDTVFRMLFQDAANALALYNGLNGSNYMDVGMLTFNTLENAIYMNMKNDVSFLIASQMNLYEHQSTWNPNMPLRNLLYAADMLQEFLQEQSLYSSKMQRIPVPTFVVFYNGTEELEEHIELRLSDAYEFPVQDPALELKVQVININPGKNEALKKRCPVLDEYMTYVEKVRSYAQCMELKSAVEQAVNECIREGILKEFLQKQKREVIMVSIYEYDEERELKIIRRDERELGMEKGIQKGLAEGIERGMQKTIEILRELHTPEAEIERLITEKYATSFNP